MVLALQVAFRLAYYGSTVPNTAAAKLVFTFDRLLSGGEYVGRGAIVNGAVLATLLVAILAVQGSRRWGTTRGLAVYLIPGIVWLTYILIIGGDFFPFERHWQPAFICFVFSTSAALALLSPLKTSLLVPVVVAIAALHVAAQATVNPYRLEFPEIQTQAFLEAFRHEIKKIDTDGTIEREVLSKPPADRAESSRETHLEYLQCVAFGELFRSAFDEMQPLIAVNLAGCLPYRTGFPAIDMLGLNDAYIAHHPPSEMGHGLMGHELGDGAYVLSRKPDFIAFCALEQPILQGVPCFRGDREIAASPDFRKDYRLVFYRAGAFEVSIWTRIENGRTGIVRTDDRIYIPGYLLATTAAARAVLDPAGKLVTRLQDGDARIEYIYLPAGTWGVTLQTEADAHLTLATSPLTGSTTLGAEKLRIVSQGETRSFKVLGGHGLIRAIVANRV